MTFPSSLGRAGLVNQLDTATGWPGTQRRPDRKGPRSKKARRRNIILAVITVFIMLSGGAVVAGGYYFDSVKLPNDIPLPESTLITYATGEPMAKLGDKNRTIIDRSKIPDMVK